MDRERQISGLPRSLNHASDAHAPERLAALVHEDVGAPDARSLLLAPYELEAVNLVPFQVVRAVGAAFEPTNNDGALGQVEVIPPQIAGFRNAQPMPIDQEANQPIAVTVARLRFRAARSLAI